MSLDLDGSIGAATRAMLACQQPDGHWVFELEADATIPAEYVLLRHYLGEPIDAELEGKIAAYLVRIQGAHGGWPLFHAGAFDMSATVKAYFALKMIGFPLDAEPMKRAREAVLSRGGAARSNVFTRIMLALFGFIPWRALPVMPIEIMLLPKWFPFHLDKTSYWSRTVIVPLLVLMALKPRARNRNGVRIDELFLELPRTVGPVPKAPQQKASWFWFFRVVDNVLRATAPLFPKRTRRRAIEQAVAWVGERLNGEDGLGAIFPAMANSVMMYDALGYPRRSSAARDRAPVDREAPGGARARGLLPALRVADLGHRPGLPRAAGDRRRRGGPAGGPGPRMACAEADPRCEGRLGGAASRCSSGRLGVSIRQPALSGRRRHGCGGHGDGSRAGRRCDTSVDFQRRDRARGRSGSRACKAKMVPGALSTPITNSTISTTSRSPITARYSIRRLRM